MALPLMPKATAVWLVESTRLTFEQIGNFCGMHPLEVQGIADGEVAVGIIGQDPIASGQLTAEDITRCENNAEANLRLTDDAEKFIVARKKGKSSRYTPIARRQDKPDAVAWFVKFHPEIPEAQIIKLIGTTKSTIASVRDRSHWNSSNIKPRDPVLLGLCTQTRLDETVEKFSKHTDTQDIKKANA